MTESYKTDRPFKFRKIARSGIMSAGYDLLRLADAIPVEKK